MSDKPAEAEKKPGFFSRIGSGMLKAVGDGLDLCVPRSPVPESAKNNCIIQSTRGKKTKKTNLSR